MVSTEELESIGWVHKSTALNGGSKKFTIAGVPSNSKNLFFLENNADNSFFERHNYEKLGEIKIQKLIIIPIDKSIHLEDECLYQGIPETLQELEEIINDLGIFEVRHLFVEKMMKKYNG